MLNAELLKELAKDCNAERLTSKSSVESCAGCPLGTICAVELSDLKGLAKAYEKKGDARKFVVEESTFIAPCSKCFNNHILADKCYKGRDPYYRCPKYLEHVNKFGD